LPGEIDLLSGFCAQRFLDDELNIGTGLPRHMDRAVDVVYSELSRCSREVEGLLNGFLLLDIQTGRSQAYRQRQRQAAFQQ